MIGYITLGSNNRELAAVFYDELLGLFGAQRIFENERMVAWGTGPGLPMLSIIRPADGKSASVGNGVMVALTAKDTAQVDAVYARAVVLGGADEGTAGPRAAGFYAGYFRDLDGNKLAVYTSA